MFKFGSGNKLASVKRVVLLCIVAGFRVDINADIVDADIPLTDLRGHFDDSELPKEDVMVDSKALSQPESNENEQSCVELAEEPFRVVAPIDIIDLPKPVMKISHLPKIGQILDCHLVDNSQLNKVEIVSRAGKATGANKIFHECVPRR